MERFAFNYLQQWKASPVRMPLMLRGARQVGKSFLIAAGSLLEFVLTSEANPNYL